MRLATKKGIKALFIGILLSILMFYAFDTRIKVQTYQVETDALRGTLRIALVADLHSNQFGEGQKELISALNQLQPDIVLLAGDIVDDEMPSAPAY